MNSYAPKLLDMLKKMVDHIGVDFGPCTDCVEFGDPDACPRIDAQALIERIEKIS